VGLFDRAKRRLNDRSAPASSGLGFRVDLARFDSLVDKSARLREVGVGYDVVERRALRDAVSFNEALEVLHWERFGA
jgi:hypothetical protein